MQLGLADALEPPAIPAARASTWGRPPARWVTVASPWS